MAGSLVDKVVELKVVVGVDGTCATEVAGSLGNNVVELKVSGRVEAVGGTGATAVAGFDVIRALRSIDLGTGRFPRSSEREESECASLDLDISLWMSSSDVLSTPRFAFHARFHKLESQG